MGRAWNSVGPGVRRLVWGFGGLCVVGVVLVLWAFWWEPSSLRVAAYDVPESHLAGLRVAVLADLHTGSPFHGVKTLGRIVAMTNEAEPDIILLAGDYVIQGVRGGEFVAPEEIAAVAKGLRAPLGVYAVLGNHDWWLDGDRVQRSLEAVGITVLEDRALRLKSGKLDFWLVGISDFWEGAHDVPTALRGVTDDAPVLAFTHNPDVFPDVPERVRLTIAGHTHGGQVRIPLLGPPVVPSKFGMRYNGGLVEEDGRLMFVSTGLGTSILPVRFLVPPEITLLSLK